MKLYIYDQSSGIDRKQANGRFDSSDNIYTLPVNSIAELKAGLGKLVSHLVFDRVLFQTHGSPGAIYFNHEQLDAARLRAEFSDKNYHSLLVTPPRIYFDGCNVGKGVAGTQFLTAVGATFLRFTGGVVFGWEDYGLGFPGWMPFIGGHTLHLSGPLKKLHFGPGGVLIPQKPFKWPADFGRERGFKV